MQNVNRSSPNILVTGTPGVGKSTLCKRLSESTGLQWLEISKIVIENNYIEKYDEVYQCSVLDADKLMDALESSLNGGGNIVDYHSCDFFPERCFDAVFVIRVDNTTLYDRLKARGYSGRKLKDNMDCEIFQTVLEEARSSYPCEIVHELDGSSTADFEENVQKICLWYQQWLTQHV